VQDSGINVLWEGRNALRILEGLAVTLGVSAVSVVLSLVLGVGVGLAMRSRLAPLRWLMRAYLEFVRIMPQIVLLFLAYFGLTRLTGLNLDGITASVLVFTLWGAAEMGDLVRGALISIPRHQYESAEALGLDTRQAMRFVILPQTVRRLAPPAVNLVTRMVKTTSLVVLIGVVEVLKVGQQIIDANRFEYPTAALWVYGVVFVAYFLVCWPISLLSRHLEKTWQN
jgi:amino ABC transporter, permease protein, 3-TM region, his/glu/gln/arg/opine family